MLDNRSLSTACECNCATRSCVGKILAVLAIALAFVVGLIIGAVAVTAITAALIPLAIFAIGLALAIVLVFVFTRCKCRTND